MGSGQFDSPEESVPRAARRLVLVSGVPVAKRIESHDSRELPLTVPDAASTAMEHHITGSPVDSDNETASVDFTSDGEVSTQEEVHNSTFSDVTEGVAGEIVEPIIEQDAVPVEDITPSRALQDALIDLDEVDVMALVRCRVALMKSPPGFLRGVFKSVLRFALQEASAASATRDER